MRGRWALPMFFLAIVMVLILTRTVQAQGRRFKSPGERIYYTGIGVNGYPIPFYGGPMWLRMHGGGCVSCHGVHGRGGVPVMMGDGHTDGHPIQGPHGQGEACPRGQGRGASLYGRADREGHHSGAGTRWRAFGLDHAPLADD